mgnify:FL=1
MHIQLDRGSQSSIAWIALGNLRCYDDHGQNKIIQINTSKQNLSFIDNRASNTMTSNRKGMKI